MCCYNKNLLKGKNSSQLRLKCIFRLSGVRIWYKAVELEILIRYVHATFVLNISKILNFSHRFVNIILTNLKEKSRKTINISLPKKNKSKKKRLKTHKGDCYLKNNNYSRIFN